MRMLTWDIETSPSLGAVWGKYEQDVIWWEKFGVIISIAWKWNDEKKPHVLALPDFNGYKVGKENDKHLITEFSKVAQKADVFIYQNGDRFDLPYLNMRLARHHLSPLQPRQSIDTLKIFRKYFRFPANNLDEVCDYLQIGRKVRTDKNLWKDCLNFKLTDEQRMRAWGLMKKYNAHDVILTEDVCQLILPYTNQQSIPNYNVYEGTIKRCTNPHCGSTKLQKRGTRKTATGEIQTYQCQVCGKYSQGPRQSIHTKEGQKHMLR